MSLALLCWTALPWLVSALPGGTSPGQLHAQQGEDVKALLNKGWLQYEEGNYDAAILTLEQALAQNPSSDAILSFVENVTTAKIYEMVRSKDPRVSGMGQKLLNLSTAVIVAKVSDSQQIKDAIKDVFSSQDQEQIMKEIRYTATFGRNLAPFLIPYLADTDLTRRTRAINWIVRIGLDAVPVLQAARKHPNSTVRRNAAYLLGARPLRHAVSLATLKAMVEKDGAAEVKEAARKSFNTILSDLDGQGQELSAKEYFLQNAYEQYYLNPYKNPFAGTYYAPTIYKLVGDSILGERVADFQLSERMAQQALEEALELDPDFVEARILLLCNDAAQVVEYDLNASYYSKHESEGHKEVKELLEKQKPYVDYILRNRLLAPAEILFDGLMQAIDDGKADVARKIVETIRETHRRGEVPESLLKALEDSNSRLLRTAAAVTLAYWNPVSDFDAGEVVVSILGDAVFSSGVRTVQKVMGDGRLANRLDAYFRELNMESYSPIPGVEAGYDAVVSSPPDVVFVDESVKLAQETRAVAPISAFVNELRKNYRSANVPVVVVVSEARLNAAKQAYESQERKVWVVPDSIDKLGLERGLFKTLFEEKDDAKALATRIAAEAAEAVSYLSSVSTRIPTKQCVATLRKVLSNRPDVVRLPCIKALGNLGATEAADELAVLFSRTENAREVRIEAMRAVGKILAGGGKSASPAVLKVIQGGMQEKDADLRRVSWYAFSNAMAPGVAQYQALISQPPAEQAPGASAPEEGAGEKAEGAEPPDEKSGEAGASKDAEESPSTKEASGTDAEEQPEASEPDSAEGEE